MIASKAIIDRLATLIAICLGAMLVALFIALTITFVRVSISGGW